MEVFEVRGRPLCLAAKQGDLSTIGADCEVVAFSTFYGMASRLHANPFYRRRLHDMGLRPETAFGCAMDFLFSPGPAILDTFSEEVAVMSDPAVLKIGIQIRTNDTVLMDQVEIKDLSPWHEYFKCAQEIEDYYRLPGQRVAWLLVSDSVHIRQLAREKFGDKLVTNVGKAKVQHIGVNRNAEEKEEASKRPIFVAAAGEIWLFSLADFHVISRFSGYGRVGAFWSKRPHSTYTINLELPPRSCGPFDYDSLRELSYVHVGGWHPGV
jgi:hypothetical protein